MEFSQIQQQCDLCNEPLVGEQWSLSDGRIICSHCHTSSVFSPTEATRLYGEMKELVASQVGIRLNIPTGLALVDRNQLKGVILKQTQIVRSGHNDQQEIVIDRTLGIYARRGMRRGIYVQTGLPRVLFLQVAAHEYAHAWQGENCPLLDDPILHEGLAEWIAYKVIGAFGYSESQKKMLERRDIYGQGLAWAMQLEACQGAQAVIGACRGKS